MSNDRLARMFLSMPRRRVRIVIKKQAAVNKNVNKLTHAARIKTPDNREKPRVVSIQHDGEW
jgi:hypothetical protein